MSSKTVPEQHAGTWSIAARLSLSYALSTLLLLSLSIGFLYWVLQGNLDREDNQTLIEKAEILRLLLVRRPADGQLLRQEVEWESAARHSTSLYVRLLDVQGRTLIESTGMHHVLASAHFPPIFRRFEDGAICRLPDSGRAQFPPAHCRNEPWG